MRALLLVGLLAACESGIVIEVEVPAEIAGATEVELFLGLEDCYDDNGPCTGVRPPGFDQRVILPGAVYLHSDRTSFRSPIDDDGIARFKIQGSGFIRYAAAVDNTERGAALALLDLDPGGETARYRIRLEKASQLAAGRPQTDGKFVEIWRRDERDVALPACFGFEAWTGGMLEGRSFIVPRDDRDCDGVPDETDCAAYAYGAGAPPPVEKTSCARIDRLPNNPVDVCMLGGMGCGLNGPEACVSTQYCVPEQFCDATCQGDAALRTCFSKLDQGFFDTPHARCTIVFRGDQGHLVPCDSSFMWNPGPFALPCEKPLTSEDSDLLLPRVQPFTYEFVNKLKIVTTDPAMLTHELGFELKHESGCNYSVFVGGRVASNGVSPAGAVFPGYVRLGVITPDGGARRMLFPLVLNGMMDSTCTAQSKCELLGDRNSDLYVCAR